MSGPQIIISCVIMTKLVFADTYILNPFSKTYVLCVCVCDVTGCPSSYTEWKEKCCIVRHERVFF